MSDFNFVARFYDKLSHLVFQNNIELANQQLVEWVEPESNILLLGGGTGELLKYFSSSVSVDYVELSKKMIDQAIARDSVSKNTFYNQDFLIFEKDRKYDYILCPFFLDLFIPTELDKVIAKIKDYLNIGGTLLIADFSPDGTSLFNKFLLQIMILFFRVFSGIKIKKYNRLFHVLEKSGFTSVDVKSRKNKFVLMKKYKLTSQA